jgi:hypothetical protein
MDAPAIQYRAVRAMTHKITQAIIQPGEIVDVSQYSPEDIQIYLDGGTIEVVTAETPFTPDVSGGLDDGTDNRSD